MARRNSHFSNANVFVSLLTAAIILLLLPTRYTSRVSLFFYDAFESVLRIGRDVQLNALHPQPTQQESIGYSEYARLWKSFKNLEAQLFTLRDEHERLAKVRTDLPQLLSGVVMARITGTVGNYSHEVIINKGQTALVRPGQYVLSEEKNALIGVVSETSEAAAKVQLITDAKQSVEVRIRREGTDKDIGAMMIGNGTDGCKISMIEQRQDVREGDTVYAAAIPNKLDVPLIAGEVVRVRPDDLHPLLWEITVMPAEDMTRLNDVAIIVADETLLKWTE
jgi:rod shape-determining protein MreC